MKIRVMIAVPLAVAALAACSSSKKTPSATTTPAAAGGTTAAATTTSGGSGGGKNSAYCLKLVQSQSKLDQLSNALTGSDPKAGIETLVNELKLLKDGAPSQVSAALDDMIATFQSAEDAITNPAANQGKLEQIGTKLEADGKVVTDYLASACGVSTTS